MDSKTYDELHGSNNWDGLLEPLDHGLRTLILRYGDLASAAMLTFNHFQGSKYNGYSLYGKTSFFKGVMLPWADSSYHVPSFLYASARINSRLAFLFHCVTDENNSEFDSNWMGYIAVSNDQFSKSIGRREICVVWRGTVQNYEWIDDVLNSKLVPAEPLVICSTAAKDIPQVMGGWLRIYNTSDPNSKLVKSSARTQLLAQIKELLVKYKDEKVSITCTGHSLGACLSVLSAFDLAKNIAKPDTNISAFVFACPQVGNDAFKAKLDELPNLKIPRIKNDPDNIPFWPSKIMKWIKGKFWAIVSSKLLEYVDVGVEIIIDSKKSPYLKDEKEFVGLSKVQVFHNLQVMLHTLGGWNGKNGEFDLSLSKRDLCLVNISIDLLKDEYKIPVSWWVEKNKGMVINEHGDWVLSPPDLDDHDLPVY